MNFIVGKPLLFISWPVGESPVDEPTSYGRKEWTDIEGNYYVTLLGETEPRKVPARCVEFVDDRGRAEFFKFWKFVALKRETALHDAG